MQETWVRSLGWEDPLERQRLPSPVFWPGEEQAEEPGKLQSMWSQSWRWLSNFHFHLALCEEWVWDGKSGTRESVRGYCSSPGEKGGWHEQAWKDLPRNWIWVIKNDSKDYPSFGHEPLGGSQCQFTKMRDAEAGTDWVGCGSGSSEGQAGAQVESGIYRFGSHEKNQDWR